MPINSDEPKVLGTKSMGRLKVVVKISPDRLSLLLDCELDKQGEKSKFDRHVLIMMIKEFVGTANLNSGALDTIAENLNKDIPLLGRKIAQGRPAVTGEDGKLELAVKPAEVLVMTDSIKDTRFLRSAKSVEAGVILGKILPPKEGTDGLDAIGQPIKADPGKPFKPDLDRSIAVKPAYEEGGGLVVVAQASGMFLREGASKMRVVSDLNIATDVDFTCGSITHSGSVKIAGEVMKGFDVNARNNLVITGRTHGGSLRSARGNIEVGGMVITDQNATIDASGDFKAEMAQNVTGLVVGAISILKDVRDSRLTTYTKLQMPQGYLLGGETTSIYGVEANIIGSSGESNTVIVCLTNQWLELSLEKLNLELEELNAKETELAGKMSPFLPGVEKLPVMTSANYLKINQAINQLCAFRLEQERLTKRIELFRLANSEDRIFRVNFKQTLHKGVKLVAGEQELLIDADRNGPGTVEFRFDGRGFRDSGYKPIVTISAKKA